MGRVYGHYLYLVPRPLLSLGRGLGMRLWQITLCLWESTVENKETWWARGIIIIRKVSSFMTTSSELKKTFQSEMTALYKLAVQYYYNGWNYYWSEYTHAIKIKLQQWLPGYSMPWDGELLASNANLFTSVSNDLYQSRLAKRSPIYNFCSWI